MFGRRKAKRSASVQALRMAEGENEPLLGTEKHSSTLSPKMWMTLGILYIVLGIMQVTLAALWRWWFGVAIGLSIAKLGSTLLGMGMTGELMTVLEATPRLMYGT